MATEEPVVEHPEEIRKQMQETRESLQEKLETLEQQVAGTVQNATAAISETVETVKETVEAVKENVQETVVSVKDALDINMHVQNHPFLMVGGAALTGFIVGELLFAVSGRSTAPAKAPSPRANGISNGHAAPSRPGWWDFITQHYSSELNKLKGLAIGAAGGLVQEMIVNEFAPEVAEKLKEVVAGVTTKLGGETVGDFGFHREPEEKPKETAEFARSSHF